MILVIDASVAAKWILPEPGTRDATALRTPDDELIAPSLILAEVASALWKANRRGDVAATDAELALPLVASHFTKLIPVEDLAADAFRRAISLGHPIYDCFYIALAAREQASLVTADEKMFTAARKAKVKARFL